MGLRQRGTSLLPLLYSSLTQSPSSLNPIPHQQLQPQPHQQLCPTLLYSLVFHCSAGEYERRRSKGRIAFYYNNDEKHSIQNYPKQPVFERRSISHRPVTEKSRQKPCERIKGILFDALKNNRYSAVGVFNDLRLVALIFLPVTIVIVPTFKELTQFDLIRDLLVVKVLSECGILFLLFEMSLEFSPARLKALAKYAFGMGLAQVVLATLAFSAPELLLNGVVERKFWSTFSHSQADLIMTRKKQHVQEEERIRVIGQALFQFLQIASNWWMAWDTPQTEGDLPKVTPLVLLVYMVLAFSSSWFIFVKVVLVATFGLAAA
ncbi:K(+) efflux antiporter 3, chloroplastic, partial [Mucuna pruriens]